MSNVILPSFLGGLSSRLSQTTTSKVMMRYWLYGCGGLISCTVFVGGATRLTNSGLSIVEWKPVAGIIPPVTESQWEAEFDKYKAYPEYIQDPIGMPHFKVIYLYEWSHRVFARAVGVAFAIPYAYFMLRGRLDRKMKMTLTAVLLGYGAQGALGWYMVKSGMNQELLEKRQKATVSAYRLSAHLTLAVTLYTAILATALGMSPNARSVVSNNAVLRPLCGVAVGCVFMSLVSGAAVAGLDAGMLYTDFPWMGPNSVLPPFEDIVQPSLVPVWRNLFENGTAAQVWHKGASIVSLGAVGIVSLAARNTPGAGKYLRAVQAVVGLQAGLGIATLMSQVYIPLALGHQAGALLLILKLLRLRSVLK